MLKNVDLTNHKVLVMGYALTGKSVAEFLLEQNAIVTVNDRGDLSTDPSVPLLLDRGVQFVTGEHPLYLLDEDFSFIVKNPGIPYTVPFIKEAIKRNIPIYTDVEIATWFSQAAFVGITGSNGKTTTTQLIYEILKTQQNGSTFLAGNIGIPVLDVVKNAQKEDQIVIELSSFQLNGVQKFSPKIAVLTNIYDAHLDYHQSKEAYIAAKMNLLQNASSDSYIVYNANQPIITEEVDKVEAIKIPFAIDNLTDEIQEEGAYLKEGYLYYRGECIIARTDIKIPGIHNIENILAAIAVAKIEGISNELIAKTIKQYKGMPHRIQPISENKGRQFFNDSKATNITATITALNSFKQKIVYIGGGLDRGNDFDDLIPHSDLIRAVYLYGETKYKMRESFEKSDVEIIEIFDTLEEATLAAYQTAQEGDVVLFSPACASWDQFPNFEVRGDKFVKYIENNMQQFPY